MAQLPPFRFGASDAKNEGGENASPVDTASSPSSTPRPKRRGRPPSIGIRLGTDGKADVSNMTPEQIQKIRKAVDGTPLLSPDEKKAIEEAKKEKIATYKPLVVPLIKLLGHIEAQVAQRTRKCTDEQASIFLYSDAEVANLQEPFAAVVAKHSGRLEGFQEEVTLALYMVQSFHAKSVLFNKSLQDQKKAESGTEEKRSQTEAIAEMEQAQAPHAFKANGTVPLKNERS